MTGGAFLITGGTGFIGSHLAEALLLEENTVTVIDDLSDVILSYPEMSRSETKLQPGAR